MSEDRNASHMGDERYYIKNAIWKNSKSERNLIINFTSVQNQKGIILILMIPTPSLLLEFTLPQADRCSVFLVDEAKDQLWSVASDSGKEIRIPRTAGIAGESVSANGNKGENKE
jgi:hypothetical protein